MATTYRIVSSINLPSFRPIPSRRNTTSPSSSSPHGPPSPGSPTTPELSNVFPSSSALLPYPHSDPWIARVSSRNNTPPARRSKLPPQPPPAVDSKSVVQVSSNPVAGPSRPGSEQLDSPPNQESSELVESETETETETATETEKKDTMSSDKMKRKVVIMGAPSVGKTSLTQQFVAPPTYNEQYFPTIEATAHKTVKFGNVEYDCEIIDSAGQDEYTLFPSKYAVGVHGYLLVYSINSRQSFEMIQTVHDKILDFAGLEKVPCVVVGQKTDLTGERRVTTAEGEALAKKLHAGFIESSAKNNENVGKAFEALLKEMQKEYNPAPEVKKSSWWSWGR
ncbi:GTP-binding protein Rheb homolog [Saitozyma sp. JCM 24511]|nr:GTP-binding protein Rheb homolog [Saitozyma sp. JCM 24511]